MESNQKQAIQGAVAQRIEPQIAFAVDPRDPTETVCDQRLVKFLMDQFLIQLAAVSGSKQPAIQQ